MNGRAIVRTHALTLPLTILCSSLLAPGVGCTIHAPGVEESESESLTAIAAVWNRTDGQLTVLMSDRIVANVLEPDEAILYEVSQRMLAQQFMFMIGLEFVASGSLLLSSNGEDPGFATGLLTVSPGWTDQTLAVESDIELSSILVPSRPVVSPASTVYLIVNATPFTILLGNFTEAGVLIAPNGHSKLALGEHGLQINYLQIRDPENPTDPPELIHHFGASTSIAGEVSAFIAIVTLQENELVVQTQSAAFRSLR